MSNDHAHGFVLVYRDDHAPCPPGPPSHTAFQIFGCACGEAFAFPASNFWRTLPTYQADVRTRLAGLGYRLDGSA
jgi:hypothetical protein